MPSRSIKVNRSRLVDKGERAPHFKTGVSRGSLIATGPRWKLSHVDIFKVVLKPKSERANEAMRAQAPFDEGSALSCTCEDLMTPELTESAMSPVIVLPISLAVSMAKNPHLTSNPIDNRPLGFVVIGVLLKLSGSPERLNWRMPLPGCDGFLFPMKVKPPTETWKFGDQTFRQCPTVRS